MVGNSLVSVYSKFGRIGEAVQVFDEMPVRDCVSFNSLIWGFGFNGFYKEALVVFDRMEALGFRADPVSTVSALKACGELGSVKRGAAIHELVSRNGFGSDIHVLNSLISMYSKFGRLDLACDLFDEMPERDLVSWNSTISGYAQNGNWIKSFAIFRLMKIEKCVPNCVTFLGLILACGQARNFDLGKSIHGHLIRVELLSDIRIGTSVLDMYAKCGRVDFAHKVFEQLYERSLISWNSLIAGYSQNSFDYEAIALFQRMLLESYLKPDSITTANVIPSYARFGDLRGSCMIHGFIVKIGFPLDEDVVLGTAMVDMYAKSFDIGAASYLFLCIVKPNVAAWNAIIAGYSVNDLSCHCLQLFRQMLHSGVSPDSITAIIMLQSCSDLRSLKQGMLIHCFSICSGFDSYLTVGNAIIDMYIKCGCVEDSEKKFNTMPTRNVVTWNTVLCGYIRIGLYMDVFNLFYQMLFDDQYKPDLITMISVLQACASSSNLQHGQIIHDFILKNGFDSDFLVANSLIDFYAKNGFIECAWSVFEGMCLRDRSSWNVMIAACGMNGQGEKACSLLFQMEEAGFQPDSITFVCFLSACSHTGLINEGYTYFKYMIEKYKIEPTAKHYSCIIDMFGRAGRLEEAYRLIAKMPEGSNYSTVWAALLSACKISKNDELGGLVGEKLIQLAPENCGYYALLSNTYASAGKWDEAEKVRRVFEERGLVKKPGLSTIKM